MNSLFAAVRHNLVSLFRFVGRDTPAQFWPYAGFVFLLLFVVTAAIILPPVASAMARMHRFAIEHPGESAALAGTGFPNVQGILQPLILICALAVFLLAAAVVRRLHDRNRSGLWGAIPLVFLVTGFALMPRLFRNFASAEVADFTLFFALFANNLLYLLSLVVLVVLLIGRGTRGPNRYGPDPRTR